MTPAESPFLTLQRSEVSEVERERELQPGARLMVPADDVRAVCAGLLLGHRAGLPLLLLPARDDEAQAARITAFGANWRLATNPRTSRVGLERSQSGAGVPADAPAEGLTFYTSGTTGVPKRVVQRWDRLFECAQHVPRRLHAQRWFSGYGAGSFAGLQVVCSALGSDGILVFPEDTRPTIAAQVDVLARSGAVIVSGTPTWWRLLMSAWPSGRDRPRLLQATLGGEVADQATLDAVMAQFRPQRLTHVYASSEAGSVIAVSDGRAGFPMEALSSTREPALRLQDGVLQIRSRRSAVGHGEDAWLDTGDLVEIREGRCHFAGRVDARLNIGGQKVSPEEIEEALMAHEDVVACAVYGRRSPLVGTVLAADVIARQPDHFDAAQLRRWLAGRLPAWKVPGVVRRVPALGLSGNGKRVRVSS